MPDDDDTKVPDDATRCACACCERWRRGMRVAMLAQLCVAQGKPERAEEMLRTLREREPDLLAFIQDVGDELDASIRG